MEIEWIEIPKGEFVMGTSEDDATRLGREYKTAWFKNEIPQQMVYLDDFFISKYPITHAQYKAFIDATGHSRGASPYLYAYLAGDADHLADHPVAWVSWYDALAFCQWAGCRLPTRAEWEKACRGPDGFTYPWGNEWKAGHCNSGEAGLGMTAPVGRYPQGVSPYGVHDMAGNVWEWTDDWITTDTLPRMWRLEENPQVLQVDLPKPYQDEQINRVLHLPILRGGAVNATRIGVRCAFRLAKYSPNDWGDWVGFRCVTGALLRK